MSELSRRAFIKKTSAGVAGVVALGALGAQSGASALASTAKAKGGDGEPEADTNAPEPIVAYVRGGSRGEVTIMSGHKEIVHRDPELVRRLLRAAK